jgi:hypothetical protein
MAEQTKAPATPEPKAARPAEDLGAEQVEHKYQAALDQGFEGIAADPTPDHHYTLAGVLAGKPTPETDLTFREQVEQQRRAAAHGLPAEKE